MRHALEQHVGKRLFCRGRVERMGNVGDNGEYTVCLVGVTIEPPTEQEPLMAFDHIWVRVTQSQAERLSADDRISFTAKIWKYQHLQQSGDSYCLAYPQEILHSYS